MGVRADNGVWVEHVIAVEDNAGKVLQVHLMDNTRTWRHDLEVIEGFGTPFEELEALTISMEFELFVLLGGSCNTSSIDLDRVIDDEVDGA